MNSFNLLDNHPTPALFVRCDDMQITGTNHAARNNLPLNTELIQGRKLDEIFSISGWPRAEGTNLLNRLLHGEIARCTISSLFRENRMHSGDEDFRFKIQFLSTNDGCGAVIVERPFNPLMRELGASLKDFLVVLDMENRIAENTSNNYVNQLFREGGCISRPITELTGTEKWNELLQRRELYRNMVAKALRERITWQNILHGSLADNEWSRVEQSDFLFRYHMTMEQAGDRLIFDLHVANFGSSGKIAVLFNQLHPETWDYTGYHAGIRRTSQGTVYYVKRNSNFIFWSETNIVLPDSFILTIERCGPSIRFFVNGVVCTQCIDESSSGMQEGKRFGIMVDRECRIISLRAAFASTPSLYKVLPPPVQLHLPGLTNFVFEAVNCPVHFWKMEGGFFECEGLLFRDVTERVKLEKEKEALTNQVKKLVKNDFHGFVGVSFSVKKVIEQAEKIASSRTPLLLLGNTGVGKGMLALAIHRHSERSSCPFVKLDCSAINEMLIDSELFGHEKGSFTGAHEKRTGRMEAADGGTLFLDEVASLSLAAQGKLLGFLENQRFFRVGGTREIGVDVRIIASTNSDIGELIKNGTFRQDLYYRLAGIVITIPALAERKDDIPILVTRMLDEINHTHSLSVTGLSNEAMHVLLTANWPGNVRQLRNVIEALAIHQQTGIIKEDEVFLLKMDSGSGIQKSYMPDDEREKIILLTARGKKYFTSRDLLAVVPVSLPTLQRDLRKMVAKGVLTVKGKGPAVRYKLP